ncbi:MAG: alpha/beta hydrolase [Parasporobacterium sp.]|nr:alpha/beta hydrolase [Parasporobacterium sp.]
MQLRPDRDIRVSKVKTGKISSLILRNKSGLQEEPGILWIHGGGYFLGMKEMVYMSRAAELVRKYGAVVVSPGYRLAWRAPYPAAAKDCYQALLYLKAHARELGVREDQIMVGGESAGGGLAAAVCMMARDRGDVSVAFQMPLYPMLSNVDTESSGDNHGRIWNTRRNHIGWRMYLRKAAKQEVPPYAAPAWQTDYSQLPPAYTFVGDGEPFYTETMNYIQRLREAGVPAQCDVYHTDMHAFDMLQPDSESGRQAGKRFEEQYLYAAAHYFAAQPSLQDDRRRNVPI